MRIGPLSEDDEDDEEVSSEFEIETVDDGTGIEETPRYMNWPSAAVAIVSLLVSALMWHDCFGNH